MEELLQLDKVLFLFLNGLGTEGWDGFWLIVTDKKSSIPLYATLLFFTYKSFGLKRTLLVLLMVALLITVTDQLANFFKYGVKRFRPCHDEALIELMRLVKNRCGGKYGYFSAHAGNSFAIASFFVFLLQDRFKQYRYLLLVWAALVAYSRIYVGVHFPLDVLTGALIGLFFGWLFSKLYIFTHQKIRV
ncbi:MAG: phosphatase PAP2 family protein [Bacteroidota bacterium]